MRFSISQQPLNETYKVIHFISHFSLKNSREMNHLWADFQSQFLTKETEKYVNESSFIGNSAGLINTLLFLLENAERWNFGA